MRLLHQLWKTVRPAAVTQDETERFTSLFRMGADKYSWMLGAAPWCY